MPLMETPFHCSNGHSFTANAKLRTRCPECGVSTKRSFEKIVEAIKPEPKPEPKLEAKPEPAKPKIGPVLVRQGRPRMATPKPAVHKKPGFKPMGSASAGLVTKRTVRRRGVMPVITKRPAKTAIARGIKGHEQVTPYWHDIAAKYGF